MEIFLHKESAECCTTQSVNHARVTNKARTCAAKHGTYSPLIAMLFAFRISASGLPARKATAHAPHAIERMLDTNPKSKNSGISASDSCSSHGGMRYADRAEPRNSALHAHLHGANNVQPLSRCDERLLRRGVGHSGRIFQSGPRKQAESGNAVFEDWGVCSNVHHSEPAESRNGTCCVTTGPWPPVCSVANYVHSPAGPQPPPAHPERTPSATCSQAATSCPSARPCTLMPQGARRQFNMPPSTAPRVEQRSLEPPAVLPPRDDRNRLQGLAGNARPLEGRVRRGVRLTDHGAAGQGTQGAGRQGVAHSKTWPSLARCSSHMVSPRRT